MNSVYSVVKQKKQMMKSSDGIKKYEVTSLNDESLFERVIVILEQARANVVRSVNSNMVLPIG